MSWSNGFSQPRAGWCAAFAPTRGLLPVRPVSHTRSAPREAGSPSPNVQSPPVWTRGARVLSISRSSVRLCPVLVSAWARAPPACPRLRKLVLWYLPQPGPMGAALRAHVKLVFQRLGARRSARLGTRALVCSSPSVPKAPPHCRPALEGVLGACVRRQHCPPLRRVRVCLHGGPEGFFSFEVEWFS